MPRMSAFFGFAFAILLGGCGLNVPRVGEIWEDHDSSAHSLEVKIKTKIYCELQHAVQTVRGVSVDYKDPNNLKREIHLTKPALPDNWGVTMTLTFTIMEMTGITPGLSLITPMVPANPVFPGGITTMASQSYSLGLGGSLSAEATRTDKFTFFYLVKNLREPTPECGARRPTNPNGRTVDDVVGSSLLLTSNLGIAEWLDNATNVRASVGVSDKNSIDEVLQYTARFNVVSAGSVNPSWTLVRASANSNGPLFATKRDRTHEMLLTFGPTDTPDGTKAPQPSRLSANDALAAQITSGFERALRNAAH